MNELSMSISPSKPRVPRHLGGPTPTILPNDRPAWTSSVTGWVSCLWCTPRWGWTLCCSGTRFPSWGKNTGTSRSSECTRRHTKLLAEKERVCMCVCAFLCFLCEKCDKDEHAELELLRFCKARRDTSHALEIRVIKKKTKNKATHKVYYCVFL